MFLTRTCSSWTAKESANSDVLSSSNTITSYKHYGDSVESSSRATISEETVSLFIIETIFLRI